jgi:hypothetical protein
MGVLILSGFLGGRFGRAPLALHASLVFEQSYGGVEGDSASLAELCALLSAIGGGPLRQDLAVSGAVSQHGTAQAIGGVNEKIEVRRVRAGGLTGEQGVIIPVTNAPPDALPSRVRGRPGGPLPVYPVATADEALELCGHARAGNTRPVIRPTASTDESSLPRRPRRNRRQVRPGRCHSALARRAILTLTSPASVGRPVEAVMSGILQHQHRTPHLYLLLLAIVIALVLVLVAGDTWFSVAVG